MMRSHGLTKSEMNVFLVFTNQSINTRHHLSQGSGLKNLALTRVIERLMMFGLIESKKMKGENAFVVTENGKYILDHLSEAL